MRKQLLTLGLAAISLAAVAQVPAGVPSNGLQAYYSFNGSIADLASDNNLSAMGNGALYGSDRHGNANAAAAFNTTNYLQDSGFPFPTGNFTVAFWLFSDVNQLGQFRTVVELDESIFVRYSGSGSFLSGLAGFYLSSVMEYALLDAGSFSNPTNSWQHIVMVNDATAGSVLYINGSFHSGDIGLGGAGSVSSGMGLTVGTGTSGGGENPDKRWNGRVDDLFIYNRALTAQEVTAIYSQANDGGTPPPPQCNLGTLALSNGTDICSNPNNPATLFVPGSSAPYSASLFVESNGGTGILGGSIDIGGQPFPFSLQVLYGYYPEIQGEFNVKVITPGCQSDFVTVNFLPAGDPSCLDCNLGTVTLVAGTDICANDQETTLFQAGTGGTPSYIRYVSNGGTGGPAGGDMSFSSINHPHVISQVQQSYPNNPLVGSWLVSAYDPNNASTCLTAPVEVNFLPSGDLACYPCSVGISVSDGEAFCPHEYVNIQSWGSASTNPGGYLTFELIPLEGQTTGIDLTTTVYPVFNNINIQPSQDGLEAGQYEVKLKMYYAGEEVPCDWASVSITILPETAEGCFCEIGTLLVDNGTIICPNETVTILEAGSVQLPIGRDLRFEIYDYPNYETYYEDQIPFDAPYTFTHDGTYFGEAVFYVYAGYSGGGGGGPVLPEEVTTRGGGNDICGSYEVFVTLAQSTDAECLTIGISDLGTSAISVHPNPTNGLVQLNGVQKGDLVEVTDMTGRLIGSQSMVSDNGTIDLSAMPNGLYLLRTAGGVFKVVRD